MSGWFNTGGKPEDENLEMIGKMAIYTSPLWVPFGAYTLLKKQGFDGLGLTSSLNTIIDIGQTGLETAAITGTVGVAAHLAAHAFYYRKRAMQEMRYVRITPHANTRTNLDNIHMLMRAFWSNRRPKHKRLLRGREWFQLLFVCEEGEHEKGDISIYIGFTQDRWTDLSEAIKVAYPNCDTTLTDYKKIPLFTPEDTDEGAEEIKPVGRVLTWNSRKKSGLPLQTFDGKDKIANVLHRLEAGSALAITFSQTQSKKLKKQTQRTRKYLYKKAGFNPKEMSRDLLDADVQDEIDQLKKRERSNQSPFDVVISMYNKHGHDYVIESLTNSINTALATQNSLSKNILSSWQKQPIKKAPSYLAVPDVLSKKMVMTGLELANLIHLPNGKSKEAKKENSPHIFDRIQHIMPGQSILSTDEFKKGVYIGDYINPAQNNRPLYIPEEQFRYHGIIPGKTGKGKTAAALGMVDHLIDATLKKPSGGLTIVDPKATFVKNVVTRINKRKVEGKLSEKQEKLFHYFDITSDKHVFGLNPLYRPNGKPPTRGEAESIIDRTLDVMKAAWSSESILFERFGRLILKALLADPAEQHTILALPAFLKEKSPLRQQIMQRLKKGGSYAREIARDLKEEEDNGNFAANRTDSLMNRLTKIKESAILRRIFGQKETSLEVLKYMQEGHIVLFNTEGLSGDQNTILMGYIMYEYHKSCRVRRNPAQNHYLFVDEAHNLKGLDVLHQKVIPEDREFGLCLLLFSQMFHKFPEPFFDAITEVAGFYATCEAGAGNAAMLDRITQGRISSETAQSLKPLTLCVEATDSKSNRVAFIVKSKPPIVYHQDGTPTYFVSNANTEQEERISKEKNKAFDDCLKAVGYKLMSRDCREIEVIEAEIDAYLDELYKDDASDTQSVTELMERSQTPNKSRKKNPLQIQKMIVKKNAEAQEESK